MPKAVQKGVLPPLRFPEFRDAGPWEVKRLGEIGKFIKGKGISKSDIVEAGALPCIRYGELYTLYDEVIRKVVSSTNVDPASLVLSEEGDVIIPASGETKEDIAIASCVATAGVALGGDLNIFRSTLNGAFFAYYVRGNLKSKISKVAQGDSVVHLYPTQLEKLSIAVPTSITEQQKIAECLSSLDELIQAEEKALEALKKHKKGLMQQLFPAPGETTPKLRFPEFRDAGPWEVKRLEKICDVLQGYGFPERLQGKKEGKFPFCKVSDITNAVSNSGGYINEAVNYVNDEDVKELRAKPIPKGTTIFAKIGEALRLNRRAFVEKECLIDNNVVGVKARDKQAIDYFVFYLSQKIDLNKHCGGAVPSVSKSTLQSIKVVVPSLPEQQKIAECLSSLDDLILAKSNRIDALKLHKKGLMQKLFPSADKVCR